jgi:two-component system response regulator HydG
MSGHGPNPRVLVIDDEESNRLTLERLLTREDFAVVHAPHGRDGLEIVRAEPIDVVLTDLKMPGMSGLDVLKAVRTLDPDIEVVVMTAYGTVDTAVEAMKEGAFDFVAKPLKRAELVRTLRQAAERRALRRENQQLRDRLSGGTDGALIGQSIAMRALLAEAEQVASSDATVLLSGQSGTGKGRLARLMHEMSRRRAGRLVTVNCAALPEQLLESELFGYEQGAFTGAARRKEGRFDVARGGTLFLDEITEIQPAMQVKLLRVLQEGEYERVGGNEPITADVRVIAACNRDLEAEVRAGRFREDLYYRLNVIRLHLPTLAERFEDVPLLAQHFLARYATKNSKDVRGFSPDALDALQSWTWPGNVRELENAVERAVVLCRSNLIGVDDLPPALRAVKGRQQIAFVVGTPLHVVERRMIEETLRSVHGDKSLAASLLGITARTIYRREAEWAGDGRAIADEGEGPP